MDEPPFLLSLALGPLGSYLNIREPFAWLRGTSSGQGDISKGSLMVQKGPPRSTEMDHQWTTDIE